MLVALLPKTPSAMCVAAVLSLAAPALAEDQWVLAPELLATINLRLD
ncbi:MAG: hypothetical protein ACKOAS_10365 [Verrucomicrobiota bacterium]